MFWFLVFIIGFIGIASAGEAFNPLSGNNLYSSLGFLGFMLAGGMAAKIFVQYPSRRGYGRENSGTDDIEDEFPISKIIRGWIYKYYFFFSDVYKMLASWWNEPLLKKIEDVVNLIALSIVGWPVYLYNEIKRDPVDGIFKTIIVIGGIVLIFVGIAGTPVTLGTSDVLTIVGASMVASAISLAVKESIEYSQAKTEDELVRLATDDEDEAVIIPAAMFGGRTASMYGEKFGKMATAINNIPDRWATDFMEMADRYGYEIDESRYWWRYGEKSIRGYDAYADVGFRDLKALKSGKGPIESVGFYKENGETYLGIQEGKHITKVSPEGIVAVEPAPDYWKSLASKQDFFSLIPRDHPEIYEQGLFEPVFAGVSTDTFSKKDKEN